MFSVMENVKKSRILIVDNDEDVREALVQTLGKEEYQIFLAESGDEALTIVKEKKPDVIFLDLWFQGLVALMFVVV